MFANLSLLSYRHFKERLPEAICCCLQTCNVDVVVGNVLHVYAGFHCH